MGLAPVGGLGLRGGLYCSKRTIHPADPRNSRSNGARVMAKAKRAYSRWLRLFYRLSYWIKVETILYSPAPVGWTGRVRVFKFNWFPPTVGPAVADVLHLDMFLYDQSADLCYYEPQTCTASATCEHKSAYQVPPFGWAATAATVQIGEVVLQGIDQTTW
jgi:hypothetical protein